MKKVLPIIAVAALASLFACGPSAEEKAADEARAKETQDSIAATVSESMENEMTPADSSMPADTAKATPAGNEHGHDHSGHDHSGHDHSH